jgi:hypothetical protein
MSISIHTDWPMMSTSANDPDVVLISSRESRETSGRRKDGLQSSTMIPTPSPAYLMKGTDMTSALVSAAESPSTERGACRRSSGRRVILADASGSRNRPSIGGADRQNSERRKAASARRPVLRRRSSSRQASSRDRQRCCSYIRQASPGVCRRYQSPRARCCHPLRVLLRRSHHPLATMIPGRHF